MLTPRHRYNRAAMSVGLPPDLDGLTNRAAPDALTQMVETGLRACVGGQATRKPKAKDKARGKLIVGHADFARAYDLYKQPGARKTFDAVLLATLSVTDAANVLREKEAFVQLYADCFFDISVFEGPTDRLTYLDAVYRRDPQYAQLLRNMLSVPLEQLLFIANSSTGERLDPKTVLEAGMSLHYNFMRLFSQVKLETIMSADTDSEDYRRFKEMFSMAVTASNLAHKFADSLLKYDLDKDRTNFLDEFILNLSKSNLAEHVSLPEAEDFDII
jgi:hypothetical protein